MLAVLLMACALVYSYAKVDQPECKHDAVVGDCLAVGCFLHHGNASCKGTSCMCDPGFCSSDGWFCKDIEMPGPDITKADKCNSDTISGIYHDLHDANNKIIEVDKHYRVTISPPTLGSKYYVDGIGKNWIVRPGNVGPIDDSCVVHDLDFNVPNKPAPPPGNVTALFAYTPLLNVSWIDSCGPDTVGSEACGKAGAYPNRTSPDAVTVFAFGKLNDAGNVWVKIADLPKRGPARQHSINARHGANQSCKEHAGVGRCLFVGCSAHSHCSTTTCLCDPGFCSTDGSHCTKIELPTPTITKEDGCEGTKISGVYRDLHDANNKIIRVDNNFHVTITPPKVGSPYYVEGIGKHWIVKPENVGHIDDDCSVHDVDFNVKNKPAPPPGNVTGVFVETSLQSISFVRSCGAETVGTAMCGQTGAYPALTSVQPVIVFAFGTIRDAGNVWVKIDDIPEEDHSSKHREDHPEVAFDMGELTIGLPSPTSILGMLGVLALAAKVHERDAQVQQPPLLG